MTVGSMSPKSITFQVADVPKPLLSRAACADMGFGCYVRKQAAKLIDSVTGERISIERRDSLYTLKMWVRQSPQSILASLLSGQGSERARPSRGTHKTD